LTFKQFQENLGSSGVGLLQVTGQPGTADPPERAKSQGKDVSFNFIEKDVN